MTKEAMEHLADLKLHQEELEAERERLLHQEKRLDEEIQLLEEALKKKRKLTPCDCCNKRAELTQHYDNYYEMDLMFCQDCLNQK